MEPRFQAVSKHDKESYRTMISADYVLHQKSPIILLYGMAVVIAAFIFFGAWQSGTWRSPVVLGVSGLLTLAICVLCVPYLDRFTIKRVCARILKTTLKKANDLDSEVSLAFGDDGFTVDTVRGHTERSYADLTQLAETPGFYLLLEGREYCYTVAKNSFTQGEPAQFKDFVAGKCGKEFRTLDI